MLQLVIGTLMPSADLGMLRLLQLCSPSFPIGAFSYSQGLEYAVEAQWVQNGHDVFTWLQQQLWNSFARLDLPGYYLAYDALASGPDLGAQILPSLSRRIRAYRETKEALEEDLQMSRAMVRIFETLEVPLSGSLESEAPPILFARACHHWQVGRQRGALGFCFSWAENQVSAAVKLVPLGQSEGQTILSRIAEVIVEAAEAADGPIRGPVSFGAAIASARHERQYSRLFRS